MNLMPGLIALIPIGLLSTAVAGIGQPPAAKPASSEKIEAAFRLYRVCAAEYEFKLGEDERQKPLELLKEPVLKWSNAAESDVQGLVFLWTRDGRPMVVGSFYQYFAPTPRMDHEFHSLTKEPLASRFHGKKVWETEEAGVKFRDIPGTGAPAADEAQRVLQLKQLAKEFTGIGKYRKDTADTELRLLPQPVLRYSSPSQDILTGGLFAFVRGTDPEIFLLIEAKGRDAATARWQFAAARMTNMAELRLKHKDKQVWEASLLPWDDIFNRHELPYTAFLFDKIPAFLTEAADKLKP
jgi:hypothetical protein